MSVPTSAESHNLARNGDTLYAPLITTESAQNFTFPVDVFGLSSKVCRYIKGAEECTQSSVILSMWRIVTSKETENRHTMGEAVNEQLHKVV